MSNLLGAAAALGVPQDTCRDLLDTVEHKLLISQSLSAAVVMLTEVKSDAEARVQAAYAVSGHLEDLIQAALASLNELRASAAFRTIERRIV